MLCLRGDDRRGIRNAFKLNRFLPRGVAFLLSTELEADASTSGAAAEAVFVSEEGGITAVLVAVSAMLRNQMRLVN